MPTVQVSYVGFKSLPSGREYTLRVTQVDGSSQDFRLAISNDAFLSRRVRYQDAAEICFLKLQRAVTAAEGELASQQDVTEKDFEDYRLAHTPTPGGRRAKSVPPVGAAMPVPVPAR